ncbi:MAG: hypothetical protein FWH20_10505 [Oscillospiraceae bacterium]|nr:hypothetical protein [Oscillospiraceae bacterium]
MRIIKHNTYNMVNPEPFEIPFPLVFELLSGNTLLAEYSISDAGVVDYSFNPNSNEKILTSVTRPLTINDIYFLFASRVFPDKTPYTAMELERFEIYEYHIYNIIRKTRGMLPGDKYWLRFENENITHKYALHEYLSYYERAYQKQLAAAAEREKPPPFTPEVEKAMVEELSKNMPTADGKLSVDDIAAMLAQNSAEAAENAVETPVTTSPPPSDTESEKMSDDAIAAMLAQSAAVETPAPEPSSEKMSDDAIAAMLAQSAAVETPAPSPAPSSEKMSDDAIAAMLAQSMAVETPAPSPAPSSEKMSDDAIAAMLAQSAVVETPAPSPSSEKMSDDAIAALLAQNMAT